MKYYYSFIIKKDLYNITVTFRWKKLWNMSWHAKPTLLLTGFPWQHSNASQSGWVFVPRKAVLIWHQHIVDNPPVTLDAPLNTPAQPWPYLSMYMLDINASTDTTYVFTCELCKPKTTKISTSKKSPHESPQNAFKSLPKMSKVFVKFNTGVPASAACEQLFSVGKDVFS